MNTPLPSLARAWLLLGLLATAAGMAQAQSAEFRRGYDQGYRDGVAAAQSGQVQMPGPVYGPRVRIEVARYGVGRTTCDARDGLQQRLAGPQGHQIRVDNGLCGDPVPGQVKQLVVRYRCVDDDGGSQRVAVPENGILSFNCR